MNSASTVLMGTDITETDQYSLHAPICWRVMVAKWSKAHAYRSQCPSPPIQYTYITLVGGLVAKWSTVQTCRSQCLSSPIQYTPLLGSLISLKCMLKDHSASYHWYKSTSLVVVKMLNN